MTTRILYGHVLDGLARLADESVHCVVTSPPYYGLRSYGTAPQVWGGDPNCEHEWGALERGKRKDMLPADQTTSTGRSGTTERQDGAAHDGGRFCQLCPAWRGDLGLEPTPELFIAHMVEVFREVRRVLRRDGTLWLNIGDSYASTAPNTMGDKGHLNGSPTMLAQKKYRPATPIHCKPKDLLMIPAQLALALRADGWWLRSEIVWAKKSPMPESCTDRPTCAHEKVFLLTKSARYFYDAEAVKEDAESDHPSGNSFVGRQGRVEYRPGTRGGEGGPQWHDVGGKRNMRNVWHLGPEPFPEAHFATFVSEIPRRAILAGTSAKGVCGNCGAPWTRVVEKTTENRSNAAKAGTVIEGKGRVSSQVRESHDIRNGPVSISETIGWRPSCKCCDAGNPVPGTVLDCFLGAGTTALVADQLGRDCIGIELAPSYAAMSERRVRDDAGMFAEIAAQ